MNEMFSNRAKNLLRDEMCVCLNDLARHILLTAPNKSSLFSKYFDFLTELESPHDNPKIDGQEYIENEDYLNGEIMGFSDRHGFVSGTEEYFIIDSIRHAFVSFKCDGIYSLYKNRQAENWYPRVVIRRKLRSHQLEGEIVIYRGTSISEYKSGEFSQSWTIKQDIAHEFAFKHYQHHDNYLNTERVVIRGAISAAHIYYHDENDNELEVIIDEREIIRGSIELVCQRTIN